MQNYPNWKVTLKLRIVTEILVNTVSPVQYWWIMPKPSKVHPM